jgi:drug/metabolite transporter (DMT)-like permease
MSAARTAALTLLSLLAFAGNSLLCRAALATTRIDPASFTSVRLVSGALVLWFLVAARRRSAGATRRSGDWPSALALFAYAAGFSYAYLHIGAGTGTLLLFSSVQFTMIGIALYRGERLGGRQIAGLALAGGGLVVLLLPGLSAPSLPDALLMMAAGIAWGIYTLRGRSAVDPLRITAGNFLRAAPLACLLSLALIGHAVPDPAGIVYAVLSGAIASGAGYAVWYTALPHLRSTTAAIVQLAVPLIAAAGGILFLGEALTARLLFAAVAILGGIALVVLAGRRPALPQRR